MTVMRGCNAFEACERVAIVNIEIIQINETPIHRDSYNAKDADNFSFLSNPTVCQKLQRSVTHFMKISCRAYGRVGVSINADHDS